MMRHDRIPQIPSQEHLCFYGLRVRPGRWEDCCMERWEDYEPSVVKVIPPEVDDE